MYTSYEVGGGRRWGNLCKKVTGQKHGHTRFKIPVTRYKEIKVYQSINQWTHYDEKVPLF